MYLKTLSGILIGLFLSLNAAVAQTNTPINVYSIIRNTGEFMIDNRGEVVTVSGQVLRTYYDNELGYVVAHIGHDDDVATLQGSVFGGVKNIQQSAQKKRQYLQRGGAKCVLRPKEQQKLALKLAYGYQAVVRGTVDSLQGKWVQISDCQFISQKQVRQENKPEGLSSLEGGQWCGWSRGFLKKVKWRAAFRRIEGEVDTFDVSYAIREKDRRPGFFDGIEKFVKLEGNNYKKIALDSDGNEVDAGTFNVYAKDGIIYETTNRKGKSVKYAVWRVCG